MKYWRPLFNTFHILESDSPWKATCGCWKLKMTKRTKILLRSYAKLIPIMDFWGFESKFTNPELNCLHSARSTELRTKSFAVRLFKYYMTLVQLWTLFFCSVHGDFSHINLSYQTAWNSILSSKSNCILVIFLRCLKVKDINNQTSSPMRSSFILITQR